MLAVFELLVRTRRALLVIIMETNLASWLNVNGVAAICLALHRDCKKLIIII